MDVRQREELKGRIFDRQQLYRPEVGRVKRVLNEPFRTLWFYGLQLVAVVKPFKINYTTLWGDTMTFYLPAGGAIYYNGYYEANFVNFLINFLREGDSFLDIGAHVGYYSMLASALVGVSGVVTSVEPTPRAFASLAQNAQPKKNITIYNAAALDREGEVSFYDYGPRYDPLNTTERRTSKQLWFRHKVDELRVKTITVDALCDAREIVPTLVKIDAEGSEPVILAGMEKVLDETRPLIVIEIAQADEWRNKCERSTRMLLDRGYECFEMTTRGFLVEHNPEDVYSDDNLLFAHVWSRNRIEELIR